MLFLVLHRIDDLENDAVAAKVISNVLHRIDDLEKLPQLLLQHPQCSSSHR